MFKIIMSQQQPDFDPLINSNQSLWGGDNARAGSRAWADVFAPAALITRARAFLKKAILAPATPVRPFFIKVARSRLSQRMATTSTVTLTPPPSPLISIILIIKWRCLESKIWTVLFRGTLLLQALFTFVFILLYYT